MTDQFDSLAPRDVVITLRSFGRRLDEALAPVLADDDLRDLLGSPTRSTPAISETVESLAVAMPVLARAIEVAATANDPVVPAGVTDASEREPADVGPPPSFDTARAAAVDAANDVAEQLDRASSATVRRTARVAGGGTVSVLEIGREAARTAIGALRAVETRAQGLVVNRR